MPDFPHMPDETHLPDLPDAPGPGRRLVICCDGTWNTPRNRDGTSPAPTNVRKFHASVAPRDVAGRRDQIAFYREGVGTRGGVWQRLAGGALGWGLNQDVQSAYKWLCEHYAPGDEIYLLGFSRGAYTVRCLAGMVDRHGILDLAGEQVPDALKWEMVKYLEARYRPRGPERADPRMEYETGRRRHPGYTPKITFLGVWDTVGALGVPDDFAAVPLGNAGRYRFRDTVLGSNVERARHALALDEERIDFVPTLWDNLGEPGVPEDVQEAWFPGVHGDLGGSYADRGLGDCALRWMMQEAADKGLVFRETAFRDLRADPRGTLHDSATGFFFSRRRKRPRAVPLLDPEMCDADRVSEAARMRVRLPGVGEPAYRPTRRLAPGESAEMVVPADRPWVASPVFMRAGERYHFAARGEWLDASLKAGPDGLKWQFRPVAQLGVALAMTTEVFRGLWRMVRRNPYAELWFPRIARRVQQAPWFGLVGVVASGQGTDPDTDLRVPHQEMALGSDSSHEIRGDGYFHAFANDAWGWYGNNRGRLTLVITRQV